MYVIRRPPLRITRADRQKRSYPLQTSRYFTPTRTSTRTRQAPLRPPESIANMIKTITGLTHEKDNGKYYAVKGEPGSTEVLEEDW
jgi:hypothetical protein